MLHTKKALIFVQNDGEKRRGGGIWQKGPHVATQPHTKIFNKKETFNNYSNSEQR